MKHDLRDTTFLLLVRLDTVERLENTLISTKFLVSNFDTTVRVLEVSPYCNGLLKKLLHRRVEYEFKEDCDPILFRTRYLNEMIRSVKTPYVSIWDVDVIAPADQVVESIELLRSNKADFIYPYKNKVLDTSFILRKLYLKTRRMSVLSRNIDKMQELYSPQPVGGAFICRLDFYLEIGLENEKFYGWGVEDGERFFRWKNSGFKIENSNGVLFHLSHPRGINSTMHNQEQEYIKFRILENTLRKNSKKENKIKYKKI